MSEGAQAPDLAGDLGQLGREIENAQSAFARAAQLAGLKGDPLLPLFKSLSDCLGLQWRMHSEAMRHQRDASQRLDMQLADTILRATLELDQRKQSVVQALAPELASMTARSVARWNRSVSARTALTFGGVAVALALALAASGYGAGWKAGRGTAVADASALAVVSQQAGPRATDALLAMVRTNDLSEAWSKCKASATTDKNGRKVCVMPMWADSPRQPDPD